MAYIYEIRFGVRPDQMSDLEIGSSLERVLGYLRTLLPSQQGYITSRAMYSVGEDDETQLVFQSVWEEWEDLVKHRDSSLAEDKVIQEFDPHAPAESLMVEVFREVD